MPSDRANRYALLFREHHPAVWQFVARRAWPDAVDDVVAETFLVAWRRFEDVPADPLPWLLGTARKVLANQRRTTLRSDALIARLGAEPAPGQPDELGRGARRAALVRALAELSERERELMLLTLWDGLPVARAARALGLTTGGASARLYRARKRLRRALAAELGEPIGTTRARRADETG